MARCLVFAVASVFALALAACGDGTYSGLASSPGVETVGDAAAAVAHRPTGSQYAATAIDAVDTFGAAIAGIAGSRLQRGPTPGSRFCKTFAGFGGSWVPALQMTLGWQGASHGIARLAARPQLPMAINAVARGTAFVGPEGSVEPLDVWSGTACPSAKPSYAVVGKATIMPFTIPFRLDYLNGKLSNVNVTHATFGAFSLQLTAMHVDRKLQVEGFIDDGRTRVAYLRADERGRGDLTITSTGAQYRLIDWWVIS